MAGPRYTALLPDQTLAVGELRAPAKHVVVPFSISSGALVMENTKYDRLIDFMRKSSFQENTQHSQAMVFL